MGFDSIWHWLLLLVIVLLIFGTKKLTNIGSDLGNAVRGFKKAMQEGDESDKAKAAKAATEKLQADPPAAADAMHQEQPASTSSKHEST